MFAVGKVRLAWLLVALPLAGLARADEVTPRINVVHLDRPLWLLGLGDPQWLFEFRARANGAKVSVFPFSNISHSDVKEPTKEKEDDIGRVTRSLALFIAERIFAETTCQGFAEVPVVKGTGPVVAGAEWPIETLLAASKQAGPDVIVSGAVEQSYAGARSRVTISIWNAASQKMETSLEDVRYFEQPDTSALGLADQVIRHLEESSRCRRLEPPRGWRRPPQEHVSHYLDALGQLLSQALAENGVVPAGSLWGESDMLDWYAALRRHMGASVAARLIYVRGILMSKAYGGSAYHKYDGELIGEASRATSQSDGVSRLAPLILARLGQAQRCRASKLAMSKRNDKAYAEWLEGVQCE
jgi:hypothetical protein